MATSATDRLAAVRAYFNGLGAKDVSGIPWAPEATMRAPLNPNGGEQELMRGAAAIRGYIQGVLPALGSITLLRVYASDGDWVAGRADIHLAGGGVLRVCDEFRVVDGQIVEQENHYDPRPALG
jgi:hypothetical protein